jgi:hypothetical protein
LTGDEAAAPAMNVGSFWFQPGKQVHGDSCVDEKGCLIFIQSMGKSDFIMPTKQASK